MQWKLNLHGNLLMNGENLSQGKNVIRWISYHHSQESTNQEQAVTSIRNLTTTLDYPKIPTYNWTFTPISNWTWSCRDFFLFTDPNTWLTLNNLLIVVGCKVHHSKARWRFGSIWLQNPKAHVEDLYEFSNWVSVSLMTLK